MKLNRRLWCCWLFEWNVRDVCSICVCVCVARPVRFPGYDAETDGDLWRAQNGCLRWMQHTHCFNISNTYHTPNNVIYLTHTHTQTFTHTLIVLIHHRWVTHILQTKSTAREKKKKKEKEKDNENRGVTKEVGKQQRTGGQHDRWREQCK